MKKITKTNAIPHIKDLFVISNPPKDTISSLKFSESESAENHHHLLATSWDSNVYIYRINVESLDTITDTLLFQQTFKDPQLDSCFDHKGSPYIFYTVGLDEEVKVINIERDSTDVIGRHKKPTNKIVAEPSMNQIISSCWGGEIKFWDRRQNNINKSLIRTIETEMKPSGISCIGNRLVIMGSTNFTQESDYTLNLHLIKIYDLRNLNNPSEYISYESPLKNEARSISALSSSDGFILGSIEGKIAVEYFTELDEKFAAESTKTVKESHKEPNLNNINSETNIFKQSYSFKSHREEIQSQNRIVIHSVEALAKHPK